MTNYRVDVIASLRDNYIYAITQGNRSIIVDPGSYLNLKEYLTQFNIDQVEVLLTHAHWDHIEGLPELYQDYPDLKIHATPEILNSLNFVDDRTVPASTFKPFVAETSIQVQDLTFQTLNTPGHTKYHVAYILDNCMFTGDLLFAAGCGRVIPGEGDMQELYRSIDKVRTYAVNLSQEDLESLLFFPGHEYTLSNIQFLRGVPDPTLPEKLDFIEKLARESLVDTGFAPVSFASELAYNPFLRADADEFTILRTYKDAMSQFKGPEEMQQALLAEFAMLDQWREEQRQLAQAKAEQAKAEQAKSE